MSIHLVVREEGSEGSDPLPGFPLLVARILATLDEPEANSELLIGHIQNDAVITARVLLLANVLASRKRRRSTLRDVSAATALIGIDRVREMVILSTLAKFVGDIAPPSLAAAFWRHSVAVGLCCEQLALATSPPALAPAALIAGMLHDVGQLWLYRYNAEAFRAVWSGEHLLGSAIEANEHQRFGLSHSTIGAWLVEYWQLPANIGAAIRYHHTPDLALNEPLVSLVHVAEVLANALGHSSLADNRVSTISAAACKTLGIAWDDHSRTMFGRMEARIRHAITFLQQGKAKHPQAA